MILKKKNNFLSTLQPPLPQVWLEARLFSGFFYMYLRLMYMFQPSLLSDLDSLTEPSLDSLPGGANVCTREEPSGASAAPVSTSLEDELMLLRLLELQGSGRGGASLVDVQSTIMRGSCGEDSPQLGRSVSTTSTIASATTASSFSVPELPTEPTRPPRPSTNPIVTADSIISTLQMEIATSGLTADAILAATRHLETVVRPSAGKLGLLTVLRGLNFSLRYSRTPLHCTTTKPG